MFALKLLMAALGVPNLDARQDGTPLEPTHRPRLLSLQRRPSPASTRRTRILIIGANPRLEAPVLNARIRKRWLRGNVPIGVIGERADLTYAYDLSRRRPRDAWPSCSTARHPSPRR